MEEETLDPVEQEPTAAEPAEPAENADPAPAEETPADPAAEPEKKENKVQKRIDEITRARRQAEQEAEYWRKVATGEIQHPPQQPQGEIIPPGLSPKPTLEQFEDYDAYVEALGAWGAEKTILTREYKAQQAQAQQARRTVEEGHAQRMGAAAAKYEDFDEVYSAIERVNMPRQMVDAIIESDQSAEIAYYLGKNPGEVNRLTAMSPLAQIKEIARLEDKLKGVTPPVKRISQAPTPVNPVGGGGDPAPTDINKITDDDAWHRAEQERLRKLGRRY